MSVTFSLSFLYFFFFPYRYISVDVTLQRLERHSFHGLRKITHM